MLIKRIGEFIDFKGTNTFAFEKSIGVANCTIRKKLESGIGDIKADTIRAILEKYPELSPDWLLLGQGQMLRQEPPPLTDSPKDYQASDLTEALQIIKKQQDTIIELTKALTTLIENTTK